MILADKIIDERKKNGWSQEELAEMLSVSRQSISKWEGAQAVPDIQKIIKMSELFGVSTDYLLKDELEPANVPGSMTDVDIDGKRECVKVSLGEASEYLELEEKLIPRKANLVSLCIFAAAELIFFVGLSEIPGFPVPEGIMVACGLVFLLILIAVAVFFFIIEGAKLQRFEYLEKGTIETMYGVSGMVKEKKKETEGSRVAMTAIGVLLCILSAVPLVAASLMGAGGYLILMMVCVLLLIVAAGVNLLVRAGSLAEVYDKLLQEGDFTVKEKKESGIREKITSLYWIIVFSVYLGWSFWKGAWGTSWIIWPVAGVLFGALMIIVSMFTDKKDSE